MWSVLLGHEQNGTRNVATTYVMGSLQLVLISSIYRSCFFFTGQSPANEVEGCGRP